MENLKYRVTVTLAITTLFLLGFCARSVMSAESYLGEKCWRIDVTSPYVYSTTYKLGLYKKDGGHFVLYGTENWQDLSGVNYTGVVRGNMEVIGNNLYTNLESIGSFEDEFKWIENIAASLSISPLTLSGPFKGYSLEDSYNYEIAGTMTLIPCP